MENNGCPNQMNGAHNYEPINDKTIYCKYCGHSLKIGEPEPQGNSINQEVLDILVAAVFDIFETYGNDFNLRFLLKERIKSVIPIREK